MEKVSPSKYPLFPWVLLQIHNAFSSPYLGNNASGNVHDSGGNVCNSGGNVHGSGGISATVGEMSATVEKLNML